MGNSQNMHGPVDTTAPSGAKEEPQVIDEMAMGGVVLEVFSILKEGDRGCIEGVEMANRSKKWKASAGKEDRQLVQDNAGDIPAKFADKMFVFCDERHPNDPDKVAIVYHDEGDWFHGWLVLDDIWVDDSVFVRRKARVALGS